jgi:thymidine phosphorylase
MPPYTRPMLPQWIIEKKRDGGELTDEAIAFLIKGFTEGAIPDYQMAAFAMAVYFKGMTPRETAALTLEMMNSGETSLIRQNSPASRPTNTPPAASATKPR